MLIADSAKDAEITLIEAAIALHRQRHVLRYLPSPNSNLFKTDRTRHGRMNWRRRSALPKMAASLAEILNICTSRNPRFR